MHVKLPLTSFQQNVLDCIFESFREREYPPTITEMQRKLEVTNPGTVHSAVMALEKKNYIFRDGKKVPRNIRLTSMGENMFEAGH